jgi:hypothetical protein
MPIAVVPVVVFAANTYPPDWVCDTTCPKSGSRIAGINAAIEHASKSAKLLESRLQSAPNNIRIAGNLNYIVSQLADAHGKTGDLVTARMHFKRAHALAEMLMRRDPQQTSLNINYLAARLSEAEMELRANTAPFQLIELLSSIETEANALPQTIQNEREGLALTAWVNALRAESNFRAAAALGGAIAKKRQLLSDAERRFRSAKAFVDQYPELLDENSPDMLEAVQTGAARAAAALAKLAGRS